MKQNTKFIWIYGLILFSFALILILFAGLTQQESAHEEERLSRSLSSLAKENSTLVSERDSLKAATDELRLQLDTAVKEKEILGLERQALVDACGGHAEITNKLLSAYTEKANGNIDIAKEIALSLDTSIMTNAQIQIYNTIIGE